MTDTLVRTKYKLLKISNTASHKPTKSEYSSIDIKGVTLNSLNFNLYTIQVLNVNSAFFIFLNSIFNADMILRKTSESLVKQTNNICMHCNYVGFINSWNAKANFHSHIL